MVICAVLLRIGEYRVCAKPNPRKLELANSLAQSTQTFACDLIELNGASRYNQSMDATQTARPFSPGAMRRYVLDSLAVGRSVSIRTSNHNLAAGLFAIANEMGALVSVENSTGPGKSMIIRLESGGGSEHFDLYTMH